MRPEAGPLVGPVQSPGAARTLLLPRSCVPLRSKRKREKSKRKREKSKRKREKSKRHSTGTFFCDFTPCARWSPALLIPRTRR